MTAPALPAPFFWSSGDTDIGFAVLLALDLLGEHDHATALRESMVELQYAMRAPRLTDAWRFFHAARKLAVFHSPRRTTSREFRELCEVVDARLVEGARAIAARIAGPIVGTLPGKSRLAIVDVRLVESCTQSQFAVFCSAFDDGERTFLLFPADL